MKGKIAACQKKEERGEGGSKERLDPEEGV